jgi:glycosyltransferase involved in cell wall biosynthesis
VRAFSLRAAENGRVTTFIDALPVGIDTASHVDDNPPVSERRKILVFAHVPPPHHGQSAMVKLMLEGLRSGVYGDYEVHHVDARFSDTMEEIGGQGGGKVVRAVRFATQAIRARWVDGVETFYYVPAPPKGSAMVRDWIVMALCRPFFPEVILHWHAVGLGEWTMNAQKSGGLKDRLAAWLNRKMLGNHYRSWVLTEWGKADVSVFNPRDVRVVPNGIPDPCPDFETSLLGTRKKQAEVFRRALKNEETAEFRVCFLGHCTAEKGLWDAMRAVAIAVDRLRTSHPQIRISLRVAGEFPAASDRATFEELSGELQREFRLKESWVEHHGFVGGPAKRQFLESADCLCFPTRYAAESFGLVAAEALAFGIPAVTSDWRMLPELMGKVGLPVARVGDPESLAEGIIAAIGRDDPAALRASFIEHFTADAHLRQVAASLR